MTLTPSEQAFLEKRRKLIRYAPWVGSGMLVGLAAFIAWLWFSTPLMINPWATIAAIQEGALDETTLHVMAMLLPILMLACLGALIGLVALFFTVFLNERKLIAMIDRSEG